MFSRSALEMLLSVVPPTSVKRGRPLLLGSVNKKGQKFLVTLRSKGGVVNTIAAVAVAID